MTRSGAASQARGREQRRVGANFPDAEPGSEARARGGSAAGARAGARARLPSAGRAPASLSPSAGLPAEPRAAPAPGRVHSAHPRPPSAFGAGLGVTRHTALQPTKPGPGAWAPRPGPTVRPAHARVRPSSLARAHATARTRGRRPGAAARPLTEGSAAQLPQERGAGRPARREEGGARRREGACPARAEQSPPGSPGRAPSRRQRRAGGRREARWVRSAPARFWAAASGSRVPSDLSG